MKTKDIAIAAAIFIAISLFLLNMMTYDQNNAYAQQCKAAEGTMASWVTPIGVFQFCNGLFTHWYFLGAPCCGG